MSGDLLAVSSFYQQSDQANFKTPSTQPANKDGTRIPSVSSTSVRVSPVSRWLPFLSSSTEEQQQQLEEEQQARAGSLSRSPCFSEGLTGLHRPSLPRPSSMFDTGEDFDEFLPAAR